MYLHSANSPGIACPTCCKHRHEPYDPDRVSRVRWVYILSVLVWIVIVFFFGFYCSHGPAILILALPLLLFGIGFYNASTLDRAAEESMLRVNCLSVGLLIVLPLLAWMTKGYNGDRKHFLSLIVVAIILSVLSMFDVWVGIGWQSVVIHIKSCLQTMALTLLIYALFIYYTSSPDHLDNKFMHSGKSNVFASDSRTSTNAPLRST